MKSEKWTADHIPDQAGTVVVVTGSSSGIGFEAARVLAGKKAEVILAVRSSEKGLAALQKIRGQIRDANVQVMKLDLASLSSIEQFSEEFAQKYLRLDRLINNAGVMVPPYSKTADGFELQFGTNHLGHFALTGRLLDLLKRTPGARVVNVASGAHRFGNLNFDDLTWEKRPYKAWRAYGDSKIANLYFTYELDRKLKAAGLALLVTAAHPGWTATDLQRHTALTSFLNRFFAQSIPMGALPTLRAAYDSAKGGEYFGPTGWMGMRGYPELVTAIPLAQDPAIAARLWEVSEKLTGVHFEFAAPASAIA